MHDRAFQDLIRDRREALHLTQSELAELARCSTRFVHMAEAGKATLRLDKLLAVLAVLGLGLQVSRTPQLSVDPELLRDQ